MENKKSDLLELVETAGLLLGTIFMWQLWKETTIKRNKELTKEVESLQKENAEMMQEIKKIRKDGK